MDKPSILAHAPDGAAARAPRGLSGGLRVGELARAVCLGLGARRLGALPRPLLVELDAPFAVVGLAQRELGPEAAAAAPAEAGHGPAGVAELDQFTRHRHGQLLAGLRLPDHEPAPGILARPARVALAVLGDLEAAHRTRAELGARDADVLEALIELLHGLLGKARDVAHELRARVFAALDLPQPVLPAAGQSGRGQRVLVEQPDHVQALLSRHQRAAVALQVANLDQPLDDRRTRRRGADAGVL